MTPYQVTPLEVVLELGKTAVRQAILRNWFAHRQALRAIGITEGFQWLDGSFCEDKVPGDLDIVTLFYRPAGAQDDAAADVLRLTNPNVFQRSAVKRAFNLDAFFVDMNSYPSSMIDYTRYLLGLFSHRRGDEVWKGMLQVDLSDDHADTEALSELDRLERDAAEAGIDEATGDAVVGAAAARVAPDAATLSLMPASAPAHLQIDRRAA